MACDSGTMTAGGNSAVPFTDRRRFGTGPPAADEAAAAAAAGAAALPHDTRLLGPIVTQESESELGRR